jgi:hypothetical protein
VVKVKSESLEQYDLVYGDYIDKVARRYEARIGRLLIRFSEVEHTLDIAIAERISDRSHELGYMVLDGLNLNNKIELFRKLLHSYTQLLQPSRLKTFQSIVKKLHEARVFRNYVAHANWRTLERSGYVRTRVTEKEGAILFKKVRITPSVLEAWCRRIERLDALLYEFVEASQ